MSQETLHKNQVSSKSYWSCIFCVYADLARNLFNILNCLFSITTHSGSSTSFSFRNVTPDDTKPYIMRVVVKPSTAESMRSTIKRQIWIPGMRLRIVQALCLYVGVENHVKCGHLCSGDEFSPTSMTLKPHIHCFIGMQDRWHSFVTALKIDHYHNSWKYTYDH